jgi:glycosyltransferase involved in cell wall biosynthesis
MRKRICIISLSLPIQVDIRTIKQIEYLAPHYDLTLIGYGDPSAIADRVEWRPIDREESGGRKLLERALVLGGRLLPPLYDVWYRQRPRYQQALTYARASGADAFLAEDWAALPAAVAARSQQPILYDADEFWTSEGESSRLWVLFFAPLIRHFLRQTAPHIAASMTVSQPIADRYAQEFGLKPILVYNAPPQQPITVHTVDPAHIRLIHHGSPVRNRRLETLIEALAAAEPRFTLDLMLTDPGDGYLDELWALAGRIAPDRVRFRPPVYPLEIVRTIMEYDIEISLIPPATYNYLMALPNKVFEAIGAGLALIVGPSPAMRALVEEYRVGWVTSDFSAAALTAMLNSLTADDVEAARANARHAAGVLNAEVEMGKLVSLCRQLLDDERKAD